MRRKTPPKMNSAARYDRDRKHSGFYRVIALTVLTLGRCDGQPIFLPTVPDRNPRTECGCQPVALISSLDVAPPGRFSSSRIVAALLPSRAESPFFSLLGVLGAFLAGLAFFPGFWMNRIFQEKILLLRRLKAQQKCAAQQRSGDQYQFAHDKGSQY